MKITISQLKAFIQQEVKKEVERCCGKENVSEVTPPGYERVVKALKKNPDVDNPWAVAWSMKNKKDKQKGK